MKKQDLVEKKMQVFLDSGFSTLLIGERGTGKSTIVENLVGEKNLIPVNCATFTNDNIADSELFGHVKGAFTDAKEDKDGLIKKAENKVLFFDEIHHLSEIIQTKLMRALSTKPGGILHIRKFGGEKEDLVKGVKLIFATNRSIKKLRKRLLLDFYDRIVQHVIKISSIREDDRPEARKEYWESTWNHLFGGIKEESKRPKIPDEKTDKKFMNWLQNLQLYGNRRDLEKIAMYYNAYSQFDEETKKHEISAFEYTKREFETYGSPPPKQPEDEIDTKLNTKKNADELLKDFKFELQERAIKQYGSRKEAAKKLCVEEKTLNNWKNRKENS